MLVPSVVFSMPDRPVFDVPVPTLRNDGEAVYAVAYWVAVVTRRRRPLFEDPAVRARCEALVRAAAEVSVCRVTCCEVWPAEVRARVEAPPGLSPREVAARVRAGATAALAEVGHPREALARRYVVTTVPVAETACGDG